VDAMRSVAVVGRCAGLVAHVEEERTAPIVPELLAFSESIRYVE
jgi:citrate synthase